MVDGLAINHGLSSPKANEEPVLRQAEGGGTNGGLGARRSGFTGLLYVWRELQSTGGFWLLLILSLFAAAASSPFVLSAYLGFALENTIYSGELNAFYAVTGLVLTVLVGGYWLEYMTNRTAAEINSRICHRLVLQGWVRLIQTPFAVFDGLEKSKLNSSLNDMVEILQRHQLYILQNLLRSLFVVLILVFILASYHAYFLLIVFPFVIATCAIPIGVAARAASYIEKEPDRYSQINGFLESFIRSHLLLRLRRISGITTRFGELLANLAVTQAGKWLIWNFSFNLKVTLNLLCFAGILSAGGLLYFQGLIRLEDLIVVYVLATLVVPRLDMIYKIYNYSQSLSVNYRELDSILKLPVKRAPIDEVADERVTRVDFTCDEFRYTASSPIIFANSHVTLESGNSYLLRGDSGVGKSTLIDLLLGLRTPSKGSLEVNGRPMEADRLRGYWQRVALHDQANLALPDRSVQENIALSGRPLLDERFDRASAALGFNEYRDKSIAELSGGELQRLCFIRAYAGDADLLIFDEPGAALDAESERTVFRLLQALEGVIVIVASHSINAPAYFDQIIDVEQGHFRLSAPAGGEA